MRASYFAVIMIFAGSASSGSTTNLDFDNLEILPNSLGLDGGFPQENFTLSAQTDEYLSEEEGLLAAINRISSGQTGADTSVQSLTLSRSDGKTFNLESFDVGGFYTGNLTEYFASDADGNFLRSDSVRTIFDIVDLEATNRFGDTFRTSAIPARTEDLYGDQFGPFFRGARIEASNLDGDFTDLVSLTFRSNGFPNDPVECLPQNLVRVDPFFSLFGPCGSLDSDFRFETGTTALFFPRNDASYFSLRSITVTDEVAPVPLPATAPLIAMGLVALGWARGRRA